MTPAAMQKVRRQYRDTEVPAVEFDPEKVNALAIYRHGRGLSRKQLAQKAGTSLQTVWLWESGRCVPSDHYRAVLSRVLGVPADQLLLLMSKFRPDAK